MTETSNVSSLCDKCHKPVLPSNDATFLDAIYYHEPAFVLISYPRHLLPTEDCEGSPSRAQYLPGMPLDAREGGYPLDTTRIDEMREAYEKLQKDYEHE
jgi:hypothetical protein